MLSFVNEQGYPLNGIGCTKLLANDHLVADVQKKSWGCQKTTHKEKR